MADTSLANTAFVKRSRGGYSGSAVFNANGSLFAANDGNLVTIGASTGPLTLTLPASESVVDGVTYTITNLSGYPLTVVPDGTDKVIGPFDVSGYAASFTIKNGDEATITWRGIWDCFGTAFLGYSSLFGNSLTSNGYQKLPSGLIIQWGVATVNLTTSFGTTPFTFPIAFPNACFSLIGQPTDVESLSGSSVVRAANGTQTGFVVNHIGPSAFATSFLWLAIGR